MAATEEIQEAQRLPQDVGTLMIAFGFEGSRRFNVCYIEPNILMHTCGNIIHFLNIPKMTVTYLGSVSGLGIGAVAVHPSKKLFAVCEKGVNPDIYIYDYPSLEYNKVLKDGTERLFSAAAFKHDGSQLATVGGYPDYWLTVWDWQNETIILRAKVFSQEVFSVTFSEYFSGQLLTSGVGHIRFWKMASTFTGMKLEGFIGKFGQVPLSDIAGYVELKNGKVLSGTEGGGIIVWEGQLVKCQLKRPGGLSCHDGMVEICLHDTAANELITAGADGYVRFWDFDKWLDAADDGDEKLICEVNPLRELQVDPDCKIKGILFEADHWLIQDEGGALWKVHVPSFELEKILVFHAGAIVGMASSPTSYCIATAGADATVRLYNFKGQKELYIRRFSTGATTLIWAPLVSDREGKTVIVGFRDGVVRVLQQCDSKWRLVRAMKPHIMQVTGLQVSPDGALLATVSEDATVFYFHCSENYRPIGFIKVSGAIRCLDWSPNGEKLLLGCKNNDILEVSRPALNPDTKLTYEITLPMKTISFLIPKIKKPKPPPPPEPAKAKEGEGAEGEGGEGEKKEGTEGESAAEPPSEQKDGVSTAEGGEAPTGEGGEGEDGEKKEAPPPPPPVVEVPEPDEFSTSFQARALLYSKSNMNAFYVSLEGKGGFLYECHADTTETLGYAPWSPGHLTCLQFSHSMQYLISGAENGIVRINTVPEPGQLSALQQQKYWQANVHDSFSGSIGGSALSCDDKFLASVAHDGSFFVYEMSLQTAAKAVTTEIKGADDSLPDVEDVPIGVYSIEEDKQKTELDNKLRAAMQKKSFVIEKMDRIRKTLEDCIKENKQRSPSERLPMEEFEVDSSLKGLLESEIKRNVETAREALQWESERSNIALAKLRSFFLDPLEVEHIVLHAFKTDCYVSSFRTENLSPDLKVIEETKKVTSDEGKGNLSDAANSKDGNAGKDDLLAGEDEDIITKQDIRRLQLKRKEAEYEAYCRTKPDENFVKPEDAATIDLAQKTKGDFKLKTDLTYIPPEEQRTNALKKTNEMIILGENVHDRKMQFNRSFLSLREKKTQIRLQIKQRNERITEINNTLKIKEAALFSPASFKDEAPEERNNVTQKDIDEYREKLKKAEVKVEENKGGGFGGFGGGGPTKKPEKEKEKEKDKEKSGEEGKAKVQTASQRKASRRMTSRKTVKDSEISSILSRAPSALEQAEQEAFIVKLKYEKAQHNQRIDMLINTFDSDLENLRHKRFVLDIKIKGAELKMLVLYQELRLLQILQPKEQALENRYNAKLLEGVELNEKIVEQDKAVELKKQEVNGLQEKKIQLLSEFETMMGENNSFRDSLFKVYSKKIKRPKPKAPGEESESEEESDLEDEGSDEDFEEEEVAEVCPAGCDEALYTSVLALRERRLDVDEVLVENAKLLIDLQREKESKLKKKKGIDIAILQVKKDMGEFQKEKQDALNKLDVAVSLYMHQVEYIENGGIPEDLSAALVFTNESLKQLRATIERHVAEKSALRKFQKELRKEYTALIRDRKAEEQNAADAEQGVIDVQMLRFGQVIDLNVVDSMRVKRDTLELKERVKKQEMEFSYEIGDWGHTLEDATDELARAMRENSASLYTIADLKEKQNNLEQNMRLKAKATFRDPLIEKQKDSAEHSQLRQKVLKQAKMIDELEDRIHYIVDHKTSIFP